METPTIVTYRQSVNSIFRDYYNKSRDVDVELQKIQLLEAAAQLLKSEITDKIETRKDIYPLCGRYEF